MSMFFPYLSRRFYVISFVLMIIVAFAWLFGHTSPPTQVYASEVPFGAEHLVDGNFDGAYSIASADVDGDGDPDLISAAKDAGDLVWWSNVNGDGTVWSSPNVISNAFPGVIDAIPADFDEDGDLDILGASATTGDVTWWENANGNGSVWTPSAIGASFFDQTTGVFVADVNQDGALDVAAVGTVVSTESVLWYENSGDGASWTPHPVAAGLDTPNAVASTDLNRDGYLDLIVASNSVNEISWWRNNDGSGLSWSPFTISSNYFTTNGLEVADLDKDGDPDLLGAFASNDTISWQENDGTGQGWIDHPIVTDLSDPVSVAAVDLDGDGDLDVLGAGNTADQTLWWENFESDGSAWFEYTISSTFDGARAIRTADINQDGIMDVLGAAETSDDVVWWENSTIHRNAYYPVAAAIVVDGNMNGAYSVFAGDFDRDGKQDLLAGGANSGEVAWYRNNLGNGTNWTKNGIGSLPGVRSVATADLNDDGTLDVLAAGTTGGDIVWWANNGSGSFGSVNTVDASFGGAFWVAAGDVDGDGDQDVLGAGFGAGLISWWENLDGNGSFGAKIDIAPSYAGATSVSGLDMDMDGDLDVLGSAYSGNDVSWWENTAGNGSAWTPHTVDGAIGGPVSTFGADMDGDGDLDVLGASNVAQEFSWWENLDGLGTFTSTQIIIGSSFANAESAFAADLDSDGDLDVAGAAQNDNTVVWFENTDGTGQSWGEHLLTTSLQEAVSVHVADVDHDGRPDILSAAAVDDDIHWWGNRGGQFSLVSLDTSPLAIPEGQTTDVMNITASHLGRADDSIIELRTFEFLFEESPGNGLGSPEANAIIENLFVYLDDGSGEFEENNDTLVTTISTLTLNSGFETIQLPGGETDVQLNPGEVKVYFIVLELTPDAGSQVPNHAILTHLTNHLLYNSLAVDANYDIPLRIAYAPNVSSSLSIFAPDLFIEKYANTLPAIPNILDPEQPLVGGSTIVEPGELITYTIFYSNTGVSAATSVVLTDLMPPEAVYTDFTFTGVTVTLTILGDAYVWNIGTVDPQSNGSITIMATLDSFMTEEYTFNNTAILTGTIIASQFSATSFAGLEINLPPSVDAGGDQPITVGETVNFTANFTDPGIDDLHQATINWGDGTITDGVVNQSLNTVFGTHQYSTEGIYQVTVTVIDTDGGINSDFALFNVTPSKVYLPIVQNP